LPVREGEHNLVWFATLPNGAVPTAARLTAIASPVSAEVDGPATLLELDPTPRSLFGRSARSR
jgi:hypothetical protein